MKRVLAILGLVLICNFFVYSQEKKVRVNGVKYIIDIGKGTARVGDNYRKTLGGNIKGTVKGDVVIASSISYDSKNYLVTSIGDFSFMGCHDIISISLPSSLSDISGVTLKGLTNLKQINVDPENMYLLSQNGVLFTKTMTRILRYPPAKSEVSYVIPKAVENIEASAFSNCKNLKTIIIPDGLKVIGTDAFYSCNFETIVIPNSVVEIGKDAFCLCYYLTSIKIPANVSKIGERAFSFCSNLTSVTYQNKNLFFPSNTFEYSSKLTSSNIIYEIPTSLFIELAEKGNPNDQYNLAVCYQKGDGFPKSLMLAKKWFTKAAEQGHLLSQKELGDIYFKGLGTDKDIDEAVKWYTKAADAGNATAQTILGNLFFQGIGVNQDFPTAIKYYRSAASKGDNDASEILGRCYYFGEGGVNVDNEEACKWFAKSANNGNLRSAYYLGVCYYEGTGTVKNDAKALEWLEKAVYGGIEEGVNLYCILAYDAAVASMNSKLYSSAITRFTSLLKYDRKNVDAYINRGYCYLNLSVKDYTNAEADFKKALELDRNNEVAQNNLQIVKDYYKRKKDAKDLCDVAYQYYQRRDFTNAVASCSKSISLDNTNPYPYYLIGYCYYDNELYADAMQYFSKSLSVDPNYTNASKALKSAKTLLILNTISQSLTTMSNALNNAYSTSSNYSSNTNYNSTAYSKSYSTSNTASSSNCGSYQRRYNKQKEYVENDINRLGDLRTNDKIYGQIGDHLASTPKPSLNVATLKSIRSGQSLMKTIRESAEKNGCYIVKEWQEYWSN